jgi:hypothetical protein
MLALLSTVVFVFGFFLPHQDDLEEDDPELDDAIGRIEKTFENFIPIIGEMGRRK